MRIRKLLKRSEMIVGLRTDLWKIQRRLRGMFSKNVLKRYMESNQVRKLQIGAGPVALPGWLGTDVRASDSVAYLDATKTFPIEDNLFDYVHSEHMIEHITWFEGLDMLRECRRILKPGGVLRIATPDLEVYAGLYDRIDEPAAQRFIQWLTDHHLQGTPAYKPGFIVNSLFFRWNHKFVYDGELLAMALREAGFTEIKRCSVGQSDDENLRDVEMHGRIGDNLDEMNKFETMVFEGKRPI